MSARPRRLLAYAIVICVAGLLCTLLQVERAQTEEAAAPSVPAGDAEGFQHGFVLGLFRKDAYYYKSRQYADELRQLAKLGCDTVTIVVRRFMKDGSGSRIYRHPVETVPDHRLLAVLREARRQGFRVVLFPYVLLESPREGEWRGNIEPDSWEQWFASYQEMIQHYARMASREGVEAFCVGSELVSSESRTADWERVIQEVRGLYEGKVFYSANWDHYEDLEFIGSTDFAAVNAYNRLSDEPTTDTASLRRSWRVIRNRLLEWRESVSLPLLITEVGYASVEGCSVDPWDYTREGDVALEEQAACLEAFTATWRDVADLAGVHFYVWWGQGGPGDTGYTPRGKPAEAVVTQFFTDLRARGR